MEVTRFGKDSRTLNEVKPAWKSYRCYPLYSGNKGDEIAVWLVENATPETRYVVIDDEEVVLDSQRPFFIWTNPYEGLTEEKADMAIRVLNR